MVFVVNECKMSTYCCKTGNTKYRTRYYVSLYIVKYLLYEDMFIMSSQVLHLLCSEQILAQQDVLGTMTKSHFFCVSMSVYTNNELLYGP
jgi:hypothetical protein